MGIQQSMLVIKGDVRYEATDVDDLTPEMFINPTNFQTAVQEVVATTVAYFADEHVIREIECRGARGTITSHHPTDQEMTAVWASMMAQEIANNLITLEMLIEILETAAAAYEDWGAEGSWTAKQAARLCQQLREGRDAQA